MKCTFDPKTYTGTAVGMFHCPECGEMILAGVDHPNYELLEKTMGEWPVIVYFSEKKIPLVVYYCKGCEKFFAVEHTIQEDHALHCPICFKNDTYLAIEYT